MREFSRNNNLMKHQRVVHKMTQRDVSKLRYQQRHHEKTVHSNDSQSFNSSNLTSYHKQQPLLCQTSSQKEEESQSVCKQQDREFSIPANTQTETTSDEDLIPCTYDSRISYRKCMGQLVPVMDYDVLKIHHPFSMMVAGPRGAGKTEFVKQLLSLKDIIMTDPPERIVWFYGRYQPELFQCLCQEIPAIEFHEGLPSNIETVFNRSQKNLCVIDDLMQNASCNQTVENL